MNPEAATLKAYEDRIKAQLDEIKAQIAALEAHARGKIAEHEIAAITAARTASDHIEKRLPGLKTVTELKMAGQLKSEIESEVAKLKASVAELTAKTKGKAAAK